jgi:hypothetical protein
MTERAEDTNGDGVDMVIDYQIAPTVLEKIVRGSLLADPRIRLPHGMARSSRHPVSIAAEGGECQITIHVMAPLGQDLIALGAWIRDHVGTKVATMTGLTVSRFDVHVDGVYPPVPDES